MMRTLRRIMALALALALAVGLVGCGQKTEAATGESTGTKVVKVGFAAPLTGDNAVYGEGMKRAVELAIEEANASEEAKQAGYKFVIQAGDDAGDPKQAVNVADALAGDPAVAAVVGHFNSGCSIPAAPVYNQKDVAMVSVSSNPSLTAQGLPNVNRVVAKDDAQGGYAGKLAFDLGFTKVALIDDGTAYGQGLAAEFKKAYLAAGGSIASEDRIQPKEVNFASVVSKIKPLDPEAIYYAGAHTEGALLTKQAKGAGLKVPVMGGDMLYTPEYVKLAGGSAAEGDIATSLGLPLEQQPRGKEFKDAYVAKYGSEPEAYDSYAYDAARIIINAVIKAGTERAAVMEAVRTGTLADGVTGSVAFDQNGDNKEQVISAFKVTNGEWTQFQQ